VSESPAISVILPVYKGSAHLESILSSIVTQEADKEIVVVADEPTDATLETAKRFEGRVRFIFNSERVGKAAALNEGVKASSAGVLLFLDSDVEIPDGRGFLGTILAEMDGTDILDVKKEAHGRSFLERMAYYEYFGGNIMTWLFARVLGRAMVWNGSCFAIRRGALDALGGFRRKVLEDMDLSARSFVGGRTFKVARGAAIRNHVHDGWRGWLTQRKRWGFGAASWFWEWNGVIGDSAAQNPLVGLAMFLVMGPALLMVPLYAIAAALLLAPGSVLLDMVVPLLGFVAIASLFMMFSKELDSRFSLGEFFVYCCFYSLLNLAFLMAGFASMTLGRDSVDGWKI
jgi:cellulose synthase/poly-beta-1,6-N-acetylglucosamine synthase-like glycosyltransferase